MAPIRYGSIQKHHVNVAFVVGIFRALTDSRMWLYDAFCKKKNTFVLNTCLTTLPIQVRFEFCDPQRLLYMLVWTIEVDVVCPCRRRSSPEVAFMHLVELFQHYSFP